MNKKSIYANFLSNLTNYFPRKFGIISQKKLNTLDLSLYFYIGLNIWEIKR